MRLKGKTALITAAGQGIDRSGCICPRTGAQQYLRADGLKSVARLAQGGGQQGDGRDAAQVHRRPAAGGDQRAG